MEGSFGQVVQIHCNGAIHVKLYCKCMKLKWEKVLAGKLKQEYKCKQPCDEGVTWYPGEFEILTQEQVRFEKENHDARSSQSVK